MRHIGWNSDQEDIVLFCKMQNWLRHLPFKKIYNYSKAGWPSLSKRWRSLSTCGEIISWINLMLSVVLLKCFTLALRENDSRNFILRAALNTLGGLSSKYQLYWEETVRKGNTKYCGKRFSVRHVKNANMFRTFLCKGLTSYWRIFQWRLIKIYNEGGILFPSTK